MDLLTFRVYGFEACPWCLKAKMTLSARNVAYEYIDLEPRETRVDWMDERGFAGEARTLPKVYLLAGEAELLIGGYTDMITYLDGEKTR